MIYGREQFGGKGEKHECAGALIPMLPPDTSNYMEDPAGDLMLTQLLAGTDVFEDVGPATLTGGSAQEFGVAERWILLPANAGQEQGFECVAGSIGATGPRTVDAVGVCGLGGSGLGQPVFTVTVSRSAGDTQDQVAVSIQDAITIDVATTTGNYTTTYGTNPTPLAEQLKTPIEVVDATPSTNIFTPALGVNQRTSVTTFSAFFDRQLLNAVAGTWLWTTFPGQSAIVGSSIDVDCAAAGLRLSHGGSGAYRTMPLNTYYVRGGNRPFSVYCSPYTGKGHIYVRGDEYTATSRPNLYHGTSYTFSHNLPTGPSDEDAARAGYDRYAVGFRFDPPATLPAGVSTQVDPTNYFSGFFSSIPRVLESTEPPYLPHSSTAFSDAERVMFLDMDGGPRTALYCDGGPQASSVDDILSAEMGGNTYSANDVSSFSNTYPIVYQEDYTPGSTVLTEPNNVVRFTGPHRQSTVPAEDDIVGLDIGISFPYPSQVTPTSSEEPLPTCIAQIGAFSAEQYFGLWSLLGQHSLGSTRADGRWVGSNRYTTNDLGVGSTTTINNLGTTAVPSSMLFHDTGPTSAGIAYNSGTVYGTRYLPYRIGSRWNVTVKNRCISSRVICEPQQTSGTASAIAVGRRSFPIFGSPAVSIKFSAATHLLFECVEAALYLYSGPHLGWSFEQQFTTTQKTVEMSGICSVNGELALTAAEQANFIAGNSVDIYCTPSTQSGQLVRTSQPGVDPTVKVTVTAVT